MIGNNRSLVPATGSTPGLPPLRYADDDAAAVYELIAPVARSVELLTVMDTETQFLYPSLSALARVPSVHEVRAAVGRIAQRIRASRAAGVPSVAFVFFSGHGTLDRNGRPSLALFDAGLTQLFLYGEILEQLPADELHLVIDACHAEAVVRPRDAPGSVDAEVVSIRPDQASAFLVQTTLARYPHVGAIMAATTNTSAHEWDEIRHGIFTHELLSAWRGAADVNRDRRLEYSEVYAFMAAANREVGDARARLAVVAKPPEVNRRSALFELANYPPDRLAWLSEIPGQQGIIEVVDGRGRRLATLHSARDFVADLLVPAGTPLYVRAGDREAYFQARPGDVVAFHKLNFGSLSSRRRGALDDAIRRGLFAAQYGRSYYEGVVDQLPDLIPVDFPASDSPSISPYFGAAATWDERKLVAGGGISTGIADLVPLTHGLSVGLRPAEQSGLTLSLQVLRASDGRLTEWHARAGAGWLWPLAYGPVRGWGGGVMAFGLLVQDVDGLSARRSPSAGAGPVLGLTTDVTSSLGIWSELELLGLWHRRDGQSRVSMVPSAWWGVSWRF